MSIPGTPVSLSRGISQDFRDFNPGEGDLPEVLGDYNPFGDPGDVVPAYVVSGVKIEGDTYLDDDIDLAPQDTANLLTEDQIKELSSAQLLQGRVLSPATDTEGAQPNANAFSSYVFSREGFFPDDNGACEEPASIAGARSFIERVFTPLLNLRTSLHSLLDKLERVTRPFFRVFQWISRKIHPLVASTLAFALGLVLFNLLTSALLLAKKIALPVAFSLLVMWFFSGPSLPQEPGIRV